MSFNKTNTFAPNPVTTRGQTLHLDADAKATNFLYTNGRAVIIRNLKNPEISSEFSGHSCQATIARYAPSGYYIASGDVQGNVKIWDTTQEEHLVKTETKVFSGKVSDIAWDSESKRLIAVGEGKDKFGHAFMFDSASSVGEISGHSKVVNSVSIRPNRPFRAVTCSDDLAVNFYHGVPYKFVKSIKDHTRFVQSVKFSPNGDYFVSAGMDAKLFLYDGKEGNKVAELSTHTDTHNGGILSVNWSPDSKQLLTCSMDTTVKLWDIEKQSVVSTCAFSGSVDDQQVGTLWAGDYLLTVSLNGDINYYDSKNFSKPSRIIRGHSKGITALSVKSDKTFFTGSYDGRVCSWTSAGTSTVIEGDAHSNQIVQIDASQDSQVRSVAMDDTLKSFDSSKSSFIETSKFDAQPKALASYKQYSFVVTNKDSIIIVKENQKLSEIKFDFDPTAITISPDGSEVVLGDTNGKVHLYTFENGNLTAKTPMLENNRGSITALAYSPNGKLLAAADSQRAVLVYDVAEKKLKLNQWVFHTAKVNSIAWAPNSLLAVSSSVDTNVEVWSVEKPMKHICIRNAHLESANDAKFLDNETVVSVGQDGFVKIWKIKKHE